MKFLNFLHKLKPYLELPSAENDFESIEIISADRPETRHGEELYFASMCSCGYGDPCPVEYKIGAAPRCTVNQIRDAFLQYKETPDGRFKKEEWLDYANNIKKIDEYTTIVRKAREEYESKN